MSQIMNGSLRQTIHVDKLIIWLKTKNTKASKNHANWIFIPNNFL